jgi:hypothetical protein
MTSHSRSSGRERSPSIERPAKSYLEQYHDIKNTSLNCAGASPTFSSLSSFHRRDLPTTSDYTAPTPLSNSARIPISLTAMDNESSKTLERWENRKERKHAEDPEYAAREPAGGNATRWSRYDDDTQSP